MNMRVAQQHGGDRHGAGAANEEWMDQVKILLVRDYGFRRAEVRDLNQQTWGVYCANGLSPEEACMAEFFQG